MKSAPSKRTKRYDTAVDLTADTVYSRIVGLVGHNKRVLDVGCAIGNLARALSEVNGCVVTGIEIDAAAAEAARQWCDRVLVGDVERMDLAESLAGERFDVVIFADVLEHLVDPGAVLARTRELLPNGCVVASLPNVAHAAVVLELLRGRFGYTDRGLLDDTHVRFFGKWDVVDLFEKTGYAIDEFQRLYLAPEQTELHVDIAQYPAEFVRLLDTSEEATTYQFVVRAMATSDSASARTPAASAIGSLPAPPPRPGAIADRGVLGHIKALTDERIAARAEADALAADRNRWRQHAEAVEADRARWREQSETLQWDRERVRSHANLVAADRDEWQRRAAAIDADRGTLQARAEAVEADRDRWQQRAEAVEADRERWQERSAAVEADRDSWQRRAEAANIDAVNWRERAEAATREVQAKEKDALIQAERYRAVEQRLRRIERTKSYRLYVALTRRFLSGGHRG